MVTLPSHRWFVVLNFIGVGVALTRLLVVLKRTARTLVELLRLRLVSETSARTTTMAPRDVIGSEPAPPETDVLGVAVTLVTVGLTRSTRNVMLLLVSLNSLKLRSMPST